MHDICSQKMRGHILLISLSNLHPLASLWLLVIFDAFYGVNFSVQQKLVMFVRIIFLNQKIIALNCNNKKTRQEQKSPHALASSFPSF